MGMVAPDIYPFLATQGDSGLDMTTVTAGELHVLKPDGSQVVWTATLSGATTLQVQLTHFFGVSPDLDMAGVYCIWAKLTVPGGFKRTLAIRKKVRATYEVPGG
jgi:hypothetical protein